SLICGVLVAEGVPMSKAPSGPTDATTLPPVVENTSTFGVTSVTVTSVPALAGCAYPGARTAETAENAHSPKVVRREIIAGSSSATGLGPVPPIRELLSNFATWPWRQRKDPAPAGRSLP